MLKLAKWCYDLGVRQERTRIAAHLKTRQTQSAVNAAVYRGAFDEPKNNIGKARKEKILKAAAVQEEIGSLIQEILDPNWEQSMTASIMFPDDKHKGEIK